MRRLLLLSLMLLPTATPVWPQGTPDSTPTAVARLANIELARQKLGLTSEYNNVQGIANIKIAVLDFGFDGIDSKRPYLPLNAVLVEHYDPAFIKKHNLGDPEFTKAFVPGNGHGRSMAQIVWGITGHHTNGPKFYLLNANGPTLFRRAVKYAIEEHVDIILFSGVFEGAGNGDGRGFLNRVVSEATAAGIIWINAAGNYGRRTYDGPVTPTANGDLRFAGRPDPTALRFRNRLDENSVTITLTWNDYRDVEDAGTLKDLDMYVENDKGVRIAASELTQVANRPAGQGETRNPRERIQLNDLPAGDYRIVIRTKTPNLWNDLDRFRVLITATRDESADPKTGEPLEGVPFLDANGKGEIYPPADNPMVLAVGDTTLASSTGATADHRRKPDVIIDDARATFTNGLSSTGASNAAAYFAGVVVIMKATEPRLTTNDLLLFAHPRESLNKDNVRKPAPPAATNPTKSTSQRQNLTKQPPPAIPPISLNTPGGTSKLPFKAPWKTPTRQQLADRVGTTLHRSFSQPP